MDIYEAIEDPKNVSIEESEEFKKTDFGDLNKLPLPEKNFIDDANKNAIRDWLLKVTVNKTSDFKLKTIQCQQCQQSIFFNCATCPFCTKFYRLCYLTGAPI